MEKAERVGKSTLEHHSEFFALLVRKSSVTTVGFRIFQVDFLMRHVQVAAEHHGLSGIEVEDVAAEGVVPRHAIVQAPQFVLRVGGVDGDEIKVVKLKGDDAAFVVVLLLSKAVGHAQRTDAGEDTSARIAFLFGVIPITFVAVKGDVYLAFLQLGFLQAEAVGIEPGKSFFKAFFAASPQAVDVPRDEFHAIGIMGKSIFILCKYSAFLRKKGGFAQKGAVLRPFRRQKERTTSCAAAGPTADCAHRQHD